MFEVMVIALLVGGISGGGELWAQAAPPANAAERRRQQWEERQRQMQERRRLQQEQWQQRRQQRPQQPPLQQLPSQRPSLQQRQQPGVGGRPPVGGPAAAPPAPSAPLPAPAHLKDMPTVEEVLQKVKGKDELDTLARQACALMHLVRLIRVLSQEGEFGNRISAEESALAKTYRDAAAASDRRGNELARQQPPGSPNWFARKLPYDVEGYRDEILDRYFPRLNVAVVARKNVERSQNAEVQVRRQAAEGESTAARSAFAADMPKTEELRARMQGRDPLDTAAKQLVALARLYEIASSLTFHGATSKEIPFDEERLLSEYKSAQVGAFSRASLALKDVAVPPNDQAVWKAALTPYTSEGFAREVLALLSPKVRDLHQARRSGVMFEALPPVEAAKALKVIATGSDEIDAMARQAAGFNHLGQIARLRAQAWPLDDKEQALANAYDKATAIADMVGQFMVASDDGASAKSPGIVAKWFKLREKYDGSKEFLASLVTSLRPRPVRLDGDPGAPTDMPPMTRLPSEGRAGLLVKNAMETARRAAAGKPAWQPPPPDPSVTKARAKKVDTMAFGIALGEALFMPTCPKQSDDQQLAAMMGFRFHGGLTCIGGGMLSQLVGAFTDTIEIVLGTKQRPSWVHTVRASVRDDILQALEIATVDGDPRPQVEHLRKKYGAPTGKLEGGLEWSLAGLYVRYDYRQPPPERDSVTISTGIVGGIADGMAEGARLEAARTIPNLFIQTETFREAAKAAVKKRKAEDPSL